MSLLLILRGVGSGDSTPPPAPPAGAPTFTSILMPTLVRTRREVNVEIKKRQRLLRDDDEFGFILTVFDE